MNQARADCGDERETPEKRDKPPANPVHPAPAGIHPNRRHATGMITRLSPTRPATTGLTTPHPEQRHITTEIQSSITSEQTAAADLGPRHPAQAGQHQPRDRHHNHRLRRVSKTMPLFRTAYAHVVITTLPEIARQHRQRPSADQGELTGAHLLLHMAATREIALWSQQHTRYTTRWNACPSNTT